MMESKRAFFVAHLYRVNNAVLSYIVVIVTDSSLGES